MKHLSEKLVAYYGDTVEVVTSNALYGPEQTVYRQISPAVEDIQGVTVKRYPLVRWHYAWIEKLGRVYKKLFKKPLPHCLRKYRWEMHCPGVDKAMQHTDADVIMATTINYMFTDYPLHRKDGNAKPFVLYGALHLHIDWPADSPIIQRAKACDCYISNTLYEKQRLIEYGVDAGKIVNIGTGIAVEDMQCDAAAVKAFRAKHSIADDDVLIGHIGRLSEGKGAGILLDAFMALYQSNKEVKLLLAGTATNYAETLRQKISKANVPVVFITDFTDAAKPVLFNALDMFVLASKGESFGVVFLEAWACKKPVLGTRMGAVASLIEEGKDGLLFEPGNSQELARQLGLLAGDAARRKEMGYNGYQKVQQQYTWPVIVEQYRNAYLLGIRHFKAKQQMG
jgi:glycosyltransferase involved in cell wall biosynthesis